MKQLIGLLLALAGLTALLANCGGGEEEEVRELAGPSATPTRSVTPKATPTIPLAPTPTATAGAAEPTPGFPSEPTETGTPEPTPTPQPEPTETPPLEATETATPSHEGPHVRAEGIAYRYKTAAESEFEVLVNEVWLEFNTGGGPVKGEAHVKTAAPSLLEGCPEQRVKYVLDVWYEGTYLPDSNEFNGTYDFEEELLSYAADEETGACKADDWFDYGSGKWQAILTDGVVVGWVSAGGGHWFELPELTVQG